jgi:hypothetical protein
MPKEIHPSRQAMRGFDSFSFGDVRGPHPVNDTLTAAEAAFTSSAGDV